MRSRSALVWLSLGIPAAAAEPLADAGSGLAVDPPAGYTASVAPPLGPNPVRFEVKKADDKDTGCQVAFAPAPQNADLTQREINDIAGSPEWVDLSRSTIALLYDVRSAGSFEHAGVRGISMVADFKAKPDIPARALEIRTIFYILETPKGRTTTVCVGERATFEARKPEFEAVMRGVTLPR